LPRPSRTRFDASSFSTSLLEDLDNLLPEGPGEFEAYRFAPARYIEEKLGWTPWSGTEENPGQQQIIDAYVLALRQLHEQDAWEKGELSTEELTVWQPGVVIKNRLRIEAGHTVGKTKLSSGLVNHFFDCFVPSIIYCFAPGWQQIHDLLFKEIKTDRRGKGLPGRILDLGLRISDNHFAKGTATNDSGGKGTERIQGQHGAYLMFVLDEAEGIPDFVWNAVDSMVSGGICIVLMLANPRTRVSRFHKAKNQADVASFRISCVSHPNVLAGREIVPSAVKRQYVSNMVDLHCEVVEEESEDDLTFTLPFPVVCKQKECPSGTILKPNAEFLFRVLGIAPKNIADDTLISVGRYEAACHRTQYRNDLQHIRIGIDAARYGRDNGTGYIKEGGIVRRFAQFPQADTPAYAGKTRTEALAAIERARQLGVIVETLHIRVDAGYGAGVIDALKNDWELKAAVREFRVIEVHFGGSPYDEATFDDLVTEMYAAAAEVMLGIRIEDPPEALETDLCARKYKWVTHRSTGVAVKRLEPKEDFRKPDRGGHSPDDGDGFVLCVAPDHLFAVEWDAF